MVFDACYRMKYNEYMRRCNLCDWMDLYNYVADEMEKNESLAKQINKASYLLCNISSNIVEVCLYGYGCTCDLEPLLECMVDVVFLLLTYVFCR